MEGLCGRGKEGELEKRGETLEDQHDRREETGTSEKREEEAD